VDSGLSGDSDLAVESREQPQPTTILVIGAHPDDADFGAGGLAALCVHAGHRVHFVSLCNGDAGHHEMGGAALARRRQMEAQHAAAVLGISYAVLDIHDGEIEPTLANRRTVINIIRRARPDLVLTHRPNDYHPDHRYTSELVQDAAYIVMVPGVAGLTPSLTYNPVIAYMSDEFRRPYPFTPDIAVDIDDVIALKLAMLHQHASQMYEWLPYTSGQLSQVPLDEEERRTWLRNAYTPEFAGIARRYRPLLIDLYGAERGERTEFAEAFEICEYGAPLSPALRRRLFPFLPG
jgi:LmbE family N-acetylglucosaminyl deacetylase